MAYPLLVFLFGSILCVSCLCAGQIVRLPATVYSSPDSSGSTCPSQDTISEERRRVREVVKNYYNITVSACSCGGPGWTRVAYLNLSDTNQQCPSNWTFTTSPVRGCGRSSSERNTCDSVTYPVNGRTYSSVCGRINAYQKGVSYAFYNSITGSTLDQSYISGVSVTHGPAGNRTHIWSFVGAGSESSSIWDILVPVLTLMSLGHIKSPRSSTMIISVTLQILDLIITPISTT